MLVQICGLRVSCLERTMSESPRPSALGTTDILEEIVEHLAPGKECTSGDQRQHVSALTRVSKGFHIPATKALWARLHSLQPLLLLLPEFETLYPAHRIEYSYRTDIKDVVRIVAITPCHHFLTLPDHCTATFGARCSRNMDTLLQSCCHDPTSTRPKHLG